MWSARVKTVRSAKCGPVRSAKCGPVRRVGAATARGLIFLIQLYRHTVSPLRLPSCRFMPTCSQYAVEALTEYGLLRGGWLAMVRLAKCGPWHRGGWDPIPDRHEPERHEAGSRAGMTTSDADPVRSKLRV